MRFRLVAALLAVGVIASACGAARLSAEEYFVEAGLAIADYDQATDLILDVYRGTDTAMAEVAAAFERSHLDSVRQPRLRTPLGRLPPRSRGNAL